jgi:hypothetical protein
MDTAHPAFQQPAPEFQDPPEDVLIERIAQRWKARRNLGQAEALKIVQEEGRRMLDEHPDQGGAGAEKVVHLLAYIVDSSTPLAELDVVAYCYGLLGRGEESMDVIAKRHTISRQAFSIKVQRAQVKFGIQPRGGMRPVAQRKIYEAVHRAKWNEINQDAPKRTA